MRKKQKWCLYIHTNKTNKKAYIGITSNPLTRRWGKNGEGYKGQIKFWNAICKYGWDGFNHEVILQDLTLEDASLLEQQYIIMYDSINNGYNIKEGGCFHTEEEIKKIRESNKKHIRTEEHKKHISEGKKCKRPVICLETNEIFNSPHECAEKLNIDLGLIFEACSGRLLSTHKLHFQYADIEYKSIDEIEIKRNTRPVVCLETGKEYPSVKQCAQDIKSTGSCVSRACRSHGRVGNKHYVYKDDPNPTKKMTKPKIRQYNKILCEETGKIYNGSTECAKDFNVSKDTITKYCKKHLTLNGFNLKYIDYKPFKKEVVCKTTNEKFATIAECAKHFNIRQTTMHRILKERNGIYENLEFELLNGESA